MKANERHTHSRSFALALPHQKSYSAVHYPKAIPLANPTGLASFSWKSLLESTHT
jgi:hypothetical protein